MARFRNVFVLLIVCAIGGAIYLGYPSKKASPVSVNGGCKANQAGQAKVGLCAPDFTLSTLDGKKVTLYQEDNKPVFINFWASWCNPCRQEMPHIQKAYEKYKDKIHFYMINVTSLEEDERAISAFMQKNNYTFPVLLDKGGDSNEPVSQKKYGVMGVPVSFVIGADGKVVKKNVGSISEQDLEKMLKSVLK